MTNAQDNCSSNRLASVEAPYPGQVVLVLQGGGALGSYQAGVYQALHEAGIEPDWIIGTSIGVCVPKTKSERIDDEARLRWRAKLWRRTAEPDEIPAHTFAKTDAF